MTDVVEQPSHDPQVTNTGDARVIRELTDALAARDSFIGLIGHELRNSVAPMRLLVEQLVEMAADPAAPAMLASRTAMFRRSLGKLMVTIDRVAEVAELRRGKLALDVTRVDLVEVVAEVCSEAHREASAGSAELVFTAGAPVTGVWDRARVKQIAANLVSNAIRYGGGGRVEISVSSEAGNAELVVQDHGPGIDAVVMARLFTPFDALAALRDRARRTGGFGIGLWIVKTLCTAMRGSVTVENQTTGGARFCVVLPRG